MKSETLAALQEARTKRQAVTLATRLSDAAEGADLSRHGERTAGRAMRRSSRPRAAPWRSAAARRSISAARRSSCNVYVPPPRLIIVGAVHIAQALAPMAALLGFDVTVVDPRRAFATANRFPGVTLIQDWPDEAFRRWASMSRTAVVTLTHDPKLDDPALEVGAQVGRLLYRRARQPAHPCQAQGAPGRGRHHRRDVRPHPRPGRPQHRRQVAGRDRRLDPRPDHRGACPSSRSIVGAEGRGRVRFGETPIDEATGAILAHSRRSGGINFSKGRRLSAEDVATLQGRRRRVGRGRAPRPRRHPRRPGRGRPSPRPWPAMGIDITAPFTGRGNLFAARGRPRRRRSRARSTPSTSSTSRSRSRPCRPTPASTPRQMVATVKIIPFAAPRSAVDRAIEVAKAANQPLISVAAVQGDARRPGADPLPGTRDKVLDKAVEHDRQAPDVARQHAGRRAPLRPRRGVDRRRAQGTEARGLRHLSWSPAPPRSSTATTWCRPASSRRAARSCISACRSIPATCC